jgi:sulfur-oxidizing protein SoxY
MKNHPRIAPRRHVLASLATLVVLACPLRSPAQEPETSWAGLQEAYYGGKKLEDAPFIRLTAPMRAASGDQVPFAFSIDHPMTAKQYIKSVTVYVDENPVPLTAAFHFTPDSGKAEVSTRIRFESDSPVHVVAETNDGKFYVNQVLVRASGGCGGPAPAYDAAAMAAAGKIRMALDEPFKRGELTRARLLIRHPMSTGLQRDMETHGFRPAFFINKIDVTYNGKTVMTADTNIGISENPSIQFGFLAEKPGALQVVLHDNKGATFRQSMEIGG